MKLHLPKLLRAALLGLFTMATPCAVTIASASSAVVLFGVAQAADVTVNMANGTTQSTKPTREDGSALAAGDNLTINVENGASVTWVNGSQIDVDTTSVVNVGSGATLTTDMSEVSDIQYGIFFRGSNGSQTVNLAEKAVMNTKSTLAGYNPQQGSTVVNMGKNSKWNIESFNASYADKCVYMNNTTVNMNHAVIEVTAGSILRVAQNGNDKNHINTVADASGMSCVKGAGIIYLKNYQLNFGVARGGFDYDNTNTADLRIESCITDQGGARGIKKTGDGILELTNTGNSYTGTTIVSGGTLRLAGAGDGSFTLGAVNLSGGNLEVKTNSSVNGLTIGATSSVTVADGAALELSGTVNVQASSSNLVEVNHNSSVNGFADAKFRVAEGALSDNGATWQVNGAAATFNAADNTISSTNALYYFCKTENANFSDRGNASVVVVDTQNTTNAIAMGDGAHEISSLIIESGLVTTTHHAGTGCIKNGDIIINGGGILSVEGQHDAFGFDAGDCTKSITLTGDSTDSLAVLDLQQKNDNSVTMKTNLTLNGFAEIRGDKGFNTYGGTIAVTGTNNSIDCIDLRYDVGVTMESGATLSVKQFKLKNSHDATYKLTLGGSGTLSIDGASTLKDVVLGAGTIETNATTTIQGGLSMGEQGTLTANVDTTIQGGLSLGKTSTVTVADGATLTLSGTVNKLTDVTVERERTQGNGYGNSTNAKIADGTLNVEGVTSWLINGCIANFDADTNIVSIAQDARYYFYNLTKEDGTAAAFSDRGNASVVVVDTQNIDDAIAMGDGAHEISELIIRSGLVTTTHHGESGNGGNGCIINGDIIIEGGGILRVDGQHDAFGYNAGVCTKSITLTGSSADSLAVLDLQQTNNKSVTMKTNLTLNGNAAIRGASGFNPFGCAITVGNTNNTIACFDLREDVTIMMKAGAELSVTQFKNDTTDFVGFGKKLSIAGNGTLTIAGDSALKTVLIGHANDAVNASLMVNATAVVDRMELGDSKSGTSALKIGSNGTVVVTSEEDTAPSSQSNSGYKSTGLILSEWNNTTTANIAGNLFAKDVNLRSGDTKFILNIQDGGTVAVKGITQNRFKNTPNQITLSAGGKLVLGEDGIGYTAAAEGVTAVNPSNWVITLNGGEVGMSADTMEIAKNITLGGAVNFNTAKYSFEGNAAQQALVAGEEGGTMTLSGIVSGTGSVEKIGTGDLILTGVNTATGALTVRNGTATLQNGGAWVGTVEVGSGTTFRLDGTAEAVSAANIILNDGATVTATGNISVTGTVTNTGTGKFVLGEGANVSVTNKLASDIATNSFQAGEGATLSLAGNYNGSNNYMAFMAALNSFSGEGMLKFTAAQTDVQPGEARFDCEVKNKKVIFDQGIVFTGTSKANETQKFTIGNGSDVTINNAALQAQRMNVNVVEGGKLTANAGILIGHPNPNDTVCAGWVNLRGGEIVTTSIKGQYVKRDNETTCSAFTMTDGTLTITGENAFGLTEDNKKLAVNLLDGTITTRSAQMNLAEQPSNANLVFTIGNVTFDTGEGRTINLNHAYTQTDTLTVKGSGRLNISGNVELSSVADLVASEYTDKTVTGNGYAGNKRYLVKADTTNGTPGCEVTGTVTDSAGTTWACQADGSGAYIEMEDYTYYINTDVVTYGETDTHYAMAENTTGIVLNGGDLILDKELTRKAIEGTGIVARKEATVTIEDEVTLSKSHLTANAATTLSGSGTYELGASLDLPENISLGSDWRGTVLVKGLTIAGTGDNTSTKLADLANPNSWVGLSDCKGWLKVGEEVAANLRLLEGDALKLTDGSSDRIQTFSGRIAGSGDIVIDMTGKTVTNVTYVFSGDVSGWTGTFKSINTNADKTFALQFTGAGDIGAGVLNEEGRTLNMTIGGAGDRTMTGSITNTGTGTLNLTVKDGGTKTFEGDVAATVMTVEGGTSVTLAGTTTVGTLNANSTMTNTGTLTISTALQATIAKAWEVLDWCPGDGELHHTDGSISEDGNGYRAKTTAYVVKSEGAGTIVLGESLDLTDTQYELSEDSKSLLYRLADADSVYCIGKNTEYTESEDVFNVESDKTIQITDGFNLTLKEQNFKSGVVVTTLGTGSVTLDVGSTISIPSTPLSTSGADIGRLILAEGTKLEYTSSSQSGAVAHARLIIVKNGATFSHRVNDNTVGNTVNFEIEGNGIVGATNRGALMLGDANGNKTYGINGTVTLTGDATIWCGQVSALGGEVVGNNHTLTKTGSGELKMQSGSIGTDKTLDAALHILQGTVLLNFSDVNMTAAGAESRKIAGKVTLETGTTLNVFDGYTELAGGLKVIGSATLNFQWAKGVKISGLIEGGADDVLYLKRDGKVSSDTRNTLILSADNSFAGICQVDADWMLRADNENALGNATLNLNHASAALTYGEGVDTISLAGLSGIAGATVTGKGSSKLTLTGSGKYDYAGTLLGVQSIIKSGSGTQTLAAVADGVDLTVSGGTLTVTSVTAGDVTLGNGATLAANVTLGGTLSGKGSIDGILTRTEGSIIALDLSDISAKSAALITAKSVELGGGRFTLELDGLTDLDNGVYNLLQWDGLSLDQFALDQVEGLSDDMEFLVTDSGVLQLKNGNPDLYWKGGTEGTWSTTNEAWATDGAADDASSPFMAGVGTHFVGAEGETYSIAVEGEQSTSAMMVEGGTWIFSATDEGDNLSVVGKSGISINDASVTLNGKVSMNETAGIQMGGNSSLTLDSTSGTSLTVGGMTLAGTEITHEGGQTETFATANGNFSVSGGSISTSDTEINAKLSNVALTTKDGTTINGTQTLTSLTNDGATTIAEEADVTVSGNVQLKANKALTVSGSLTSDNLVISGCTITADAGKQLSLWNGGTTEGLTITDGSITDNTINLKGRIVNAALHGVNYTFKGSGNLTLNGTQSIGTLMTSSSVLVGGPISDEVTAPVVKNSKLTVGNTVLSGSGITITTGDKAFSLGSDKTTVTNGSVATSEAAIKATLTNVGLTTGTTGTTTITGTQALASLTNGGATTIAEEADVTVSGNVQLKANKALTVSGSLKNDGLVITGSTITATADKALGLADENISVSGGSIADSNADSTVNATLTNVNYTHNGAGTLTLNGRQSIGSLDASSLALGNSSTLSVENLTLSQGGTLTLNNESRLSATNVTGLTSITFNGALTNLSSENLAFNITNGANSLTLKGLSLNILKNATTYDSDDVLHLGHVGGLTDLSVDGLTADAQGTLFFEDSDLKQKYIISGTDGAITVSRTSSANGWCGTAEDGTDTAVWENGGSDEFAEQPDADTEAGFTGGGASQVEIVGDKEVSGIVVNIPSGSDKTDGYTFLNGNEGGTTSVTAGETQIQRGGLTVGENVVLDTETMTVNQQGSLTIDDGAEVKVSGAATGAITNNGDLSVGDKSNITLGGEGNLTVKENASVTLGSDTTLAQLNNQGTLTVSGDLELTDATTQGGNVTVGNLTLDDNTANTFTTLEATGTVKSTGTLTVGNKTNIRVLSGEGNLTVAKEASVELASDTTLTQLNNQGTLTVSGDLELTDTTTQGGNVTADSLKLGGASYTFAEMTLDTIVYDETKMEADTALIMADSLEAKMAQSVTFAQKNTENLLESADTPYILLTTTGKLGDCVLDAATKSAYQTNGYAVKLVKASEEMQTMAMFAADDDNATDPAGDALLLYIVQDTKRTWDTSTLTVKDSLGNTVVDADGNDLELVLNGPDAYNSLDNIYYVKVNADRTIDLTNATPATDDGLVVNNLSGNGKNTLSIVGNGIDNDKVTLATAEDFTTEQADKTANLSLSKLSTTLDGDTTLDNLTLDNVALTTGDNTLTVSQLTGDEKSTLAGKVKVTGTWGYNGSYSDTTQLTLARNETTTLTSDTKLSLSGKNQNVKLDGTAMKGVNLKGSRLTLNDTLKLKDASAVTNGAIIFNTTITDANAPIVVTEGASLDVSGTTIDINADAQQGLSLDLSNGTTGRVIGKLADGVSKDARTSVALQGNFFDRYYRNASLLDNGNIVADVVTDYYGSMLDDLSNNATVGITLLDRAALVNTPQYAADKAPDQKKLLDALDTALATDDEEQLEKLPAAFAGAGTAAMGAALAGDMERQLRAIRNRTTTMGVSSDYVYDNMPAFNAWINAEGDYRTLDADGTMAGYKLNSWGGTVGMDADITPHLTAGLAVTAMYGDLQADSAETKAEGDLDTYYVSLFARYADKAWVHTFVASVGMADLTMDRTVTCGTEGSYTTSGDTSGISFGLMYETGYVIALDEEGSACLQPVANITYKHTAVDGYTESGSDAALKVGDQTLDTVTIGVGARFQAAVGETIYNRTSLLEMRALAKVEAGDRSSSADIILPGVPGANGTVKSAEADAFGIELGAGVTIPIGVDAGALFIDASAELRGSYTNVNGTVGYRINF